MASIKPNPLHHLAFLSDEEREHDGLEAELAPNRKRDFTLEDQVIGKLGQAEEEGMKLLLKGGMI